MNLAVRILITVFCFINFVSCSESANLEETATFREDFSKDNLSNVKWGTPNFSMYKFKSAPDMVSNSEGINYLKLGLSDNDIYPSGFIYVKESYSYGSYSARIKVSDMPGAVASFFVCTEISNIFSDGTHDEIDFEFITAKSNAVLFTTWYLATGTEGGEQTPTHNSFMWEDPSFNIHEWHDYRFDWFSDKVDFYIDGIKRWTSTKAIPKRNMQIALHMYTIDTWEEVQYPPKGEILQLTDWVEYRKFKE